MSKAQKEAVEAEPELMHPLETNGEDMDDRERSYDGLEKRSSINGREQRWYPRCPRFPNWSSKTPADNQVTSVNSTYHFKKTLEINGRDYWAPLESLKIIFVSDFRRCRIFILYRILA